LLKPELDITSAPSR